MKKTNTNTWYTLEFLAGIALFIIITFKGITKLKEKITKVGILVFVVTHPLEIKLT